MSRNGVIAARSQDVFPDLAALPLRPAISALVDWYKRTGEIFLEILGSWLQLLSRCTILFERLVSRIPDTCDRGVIEVDYGPFLQIAYTIYLPHMQSSVRTGRRQALNPAVTLGFPGNRFAGPRAPVIV